MKEREPIAAKEENPNELSCVRDTPPEKEGGSRDGIEQRKGREKSSLAKHREGGGVSRRRRKKEGPLLRGRGPCKRKTTLGG